jgi:molybdopterin molybdotransferase
LTFEEALQRLLDGVEPLLEERVAVGECDGRVLSRDVHAQGDLPPFDYSAMDGYALSAGFLQGSGPWSLPVRGESRTGQAAPALGNGHACRIFTGAAIPAGADAVVMQEDVAVQGEAILVSRPLAPGSHIRRGGEDMRAGTLALASGTRLGPGHLALAASVDAAWLWVHRRPQLTLVSTGDELRYPGEPQRPASIPESISPALTAMARRAGAQVRAAPFALDEPQATGSILSDALRASDLLVTVGGVSVGDHDLVRPALQAAGVRIEFWRVKIKPGKPLAVGTGPSGRVLGLPGNPASAQVTFALFGMPLLRALQGDRRPCPPRLHARLVHEVRSSSERTEFMRGVLQWQGSQLHVGALANQASGATTAMASADCLLVITPSAAPLPTGTEVEVIRLADV